jgi:hypothetical protein
MPSIVRSRFIDLSFTEGHFFPAMPFKRACYDLRETVLKMII